MLAHFPALPLVVDYADEVRGLTGKGGGGLWCALLPGPERRDRVRRIRLLIHQPHQWSFVAMLFDGTFPKLEYLFVKLRERGHASLKLPDTFQAPRLRHLVLTHLGFPLVSPILVTSVHLVTLSLNLVIYCLPNDLLERLSPLPRLETLHIASTFSIPEGSSSMPWGQAPPRQTPLNTHVTLSNLHSFVFEGNSAYMKALLPGMTTPLLGGFQAVFFNQKIPPVSYLLSCKTTADDPDFSFGSAWFRFHPKGVSVCVCPCDGDSKYVFSLHAFRQALNLQLSFVSQLFDGPSPLPASVASLSLDYSQGIVSSEQHDDSEDRPIHWHNLLRSFRNVEILRVHGELSPDISRSLLLGSEGEPLSRVLLPQLKELQYTETDDSADAGNAFGAFIDARGAAGHPVSLVHATAPVLPPAITGIFSRPYQS
jgi:hypothetical protein